MAHDLVVVFDGAFALTGEGTMWRGLLVTTRHVYATESGAGRITRLPR